MSPEIDTGAMGEVPDRGSRGHNPFVKEIDVETETAIAVKGAFASAERSDERRHNPQHVAEPVLAQRKARHAAPRLLVVGQHVERATTKRHARRIGG